MSKVNIHESSVKYKRKAITTILALGVGGLHFVTGTSYGGPFPEFVNGYLIDILLPAVMVLITGFIEQKYLRLSFVRAGLVFSVGATVETLQYYGVPLFGQTFDPLDYLAYGSGVSLGMLFEKVVLDRYWKWTR